MRIYVCIYIYIYIYLERERERDRGGGVFAEHRPALETCAPELVVSKLGREIYGAKHNCMLKVRYAGSGVCKVIARPLTPTSRLDAKMET